MGRLEIYPDKLQLDGQEFPLICGDFHYFRTLPGGWRRRLALMRDFGLTALQTYVAWNRHEREEGVYDFARELDLDAFLTLVEEYGLKVLLRPGPYICSETDFGGLPWWLLRDPRAAVRCSDECYLAAIDRWAARLAEEYLPHLSTRGGCVIAICVENEYGSYGSDTAYLNHIRDTCRALGVDVPLYTTDGAGGAYSKYGQMDGLWAGVNYRIETEEAFTILRSERPDQLPFAGEYWNGRSSHWDETFFHREPAPIADGFMKALEMGGGICAYMFCGGTNFGFWNGANFSTYSPRPDAHAVLYRPLVTSYDVDAMVSEDGIPSEKYFITRDRLDAFLQKPPRAYRTAASGADAHRPADAPL